jgi:hypothetical protein
MLPSHERAAAPTPMVWLSGLALVREQHDQEERQDGREGD